MSMTNRILAVATNVGEYKKAGFRTGLWLGELVHFWHTVEQAGFEVDLATPAGGYVPIDPESLMAQELGHTIGLPGTVHRYYADRAFMNRLIDTRRVADAQVASYDAIYLTGGHGACFDFAESAELAGLVTQFYTSGRIVSAVCHGACGLLEARLANGTYLINGKNVTGFSWTEEKLVGRDAVVPYSLEGELMRRGAHFKKGGLPFTSHVEQDHHLITGQNPASATAVAKAVVHALEMLVPHRRAG